MENAFDWVYTYFLQYLYQINILYTIANPPESIIIKKKAKALWWFQELNQQKTI